MAYTTRQLITNAYYLSQLVARELETPSATQIDDGLFRLNGFIASKSSNMSMIPYYTVHNDNFVAGQELYSIPNLIEIETMTFNIGTVRYQMWDQTRYDYFQLPRVDNIKSLPLTWHLERKLNGADVRVYYAPQDNYPYEIVGKFKLNSTSLNQDLDFVYDLFYQEYLLHGLAVYLCNYNSVEPPPAVVAQLKELEAQIMDTSPMDLTMRKMEYFSSNGFFNWGDVNIGRGWRPN